MLTARSSICLNMIVRNESALIERCLTAAAAHIDCYVICDTGSTDDTVEKIRTFFAARNIPGVIAHTTFQDFEQARNFALDAARDSDLEFDYLLLCDADMELVVERPAFREEPAGVPYLVAQHSTGGDLQYQNLRLVPRRCPARYRGVTHEYLDVTPAERVGFDGIWFRDHAAGSNRTDKFNRDITLLTQGLQAEPDNERYVFYLANTYFDRTTSRSNDLVRQTRADGRMGGGNLLCVLPDRRMLRAPWPRIGDDRPVFADLSTVSASRRAVARAGSVLPTSLGEPVGLPVRRRRPAGSAAARRGVVRGGPGV